MNELRQELLKLGFLNVTGTLERSGNHPQGVRVPVQRPNKRLRHNYNNGLFVVIDGFGHSWIAPYKLVNTDDLKNLEQNFGLKGGDCYVPHSNDGGRFMCQIWPHI